MPSISATSRIAASGSQPPFCSCARPPRPPPPFLPPPPPQQRNDGRLLTAGRIFRDLLLRPGGILRREGELLRLLVGRRYAAIGHGLVFRHRSTSPNTMSSEPRMAETSASMWPRQRKSIACRCAKPGARTLHLYGLLVPSATR